MLALPKIREEIAAGRSVTVENRTQGHSFTMCHQLSSREAEIVLVGGLLAPPRSRQIATLMLPEPN